MGGTEIERENDKTGISGIWGVVLLIQVYILAISLHGNLTREYQSIDVDLRSFKGDAQMMTGEGSLTITSPILWPEDETEYEVGYEPEYEARSVVSESFSLGSGCYRLSVDYDASTNPSQQPDYRDAAGYLYLQSEKNEIALLADHLELDDAVHHVEENFWIRSGVRLENVQVGLRYQGRGYVMIHSIHIEESRLYRVVRFLIRLAVFAFMDLGLVFFGRPLEELSADQRRRREEVLVIGGLTLFASLPCFANFLYNGHDLGFHLQRIAEVAHELSDHQFPVRMMTRMLNGYGYATPLYYCDIFLYLPALLFCCQLPLQTCYQVYVVLVNLATAWIAYHSFSRIAANRRIGYVGCCVYMLAAYRFTNLHVRAAVGEYTAMIFMPLVVLGIYEIYREEKPTARNWLPLAFGMSGAVLCHVLSAQMLGIFLVLFGLLCLQRSLRLHRLAALAKAALLSLTLTAWFLVPLADMFLHYKVNVSEEIYNKQDQGTYWVQLFGGMMTGLGQSNWQTWGDGPFTLGLSLVLGLILMFLLVMYGKREIREKMDYDYAALKVSLFLAVLAIWLTTYSFPWDSLESWFGEGIARFWNRVQFPWRYLGIASLIITTGIVLALKLLSEEKRKARIAAVVLCASSVFVISNFYLSFITDSGTIIKGTDSYKDTGHIMGGEYVPENTNFYYVNYVNYPESSDDALKLLDYYKDSGKAYLTCRNEGSRWNIVHVPIFDYPNYVASDAETGENIELLADMANSNRLALNIPEGYDGTIVIRYRPPFLWRAAECVSWATLFGLLAVFVMSMRRVGRDSPIFS